MAKRIAVLGDVTTTGGWLVSASGKGFCGGQGIALLGDYVSCPTCKSMGKLFRLPITLWLMASLLPMMDVLWHVLVPLWLR